MTYHALAVSGDRGRGVGVKGAEGKDHVIHGFKVMRRKLEVTMVTPFQ